MSTTVRVWDLPTRIFHWILVLCVAALLVTANVGGGAMAWHLRFGYMVIVLLLFRLIWGFVGGRWSRFASFVYTPGALWRYLRGRHSPVVIGHSPMGALSVFAMLLFLLAQVSSGLFSDDEISVSGPFSHLVSSSWVSLATYYHTRVGKLVILSLIVVHIAAILFYWHRRGQNLLVPMIFGDKELSQPAPGSRDDLRSRWLAILLFLACLALIGLTIGSQA